MQEPSGRPTRHQTQPGTVRLDSCPTIRLAGSKRTNIGGRMRRIRFLVVAAVGAVTVGVGGAILILRDDPTRDADTIGSVSAQGVAQDAAVDAVGLERCDKVPALASRLEGNLGARQNPNPVVMELIGTYRDEHAETYGGRWIDRENGAVVVAFTDDSEAHREAILALSPSPDGTSDVDPRPLGQRDDVTIDVLQVRYTQVQLEARTSSPSRGACARSAHVPGAVADAPADVAGPARSSGLVDDGLPPTRA